MATELKIDTTFKKILFWNAVTVSALLTIMWVVMVIADIILGYLVPPIYVGA